MGLAGIETRNPFNLVTCRHRRKPLTFDCKNGCADRTSCPAVAVAPAQPPLRPAFAVPPPARQDCTAPPADKRVPEFSAGGP